jgi:hypothetical protein
MDAFDEIRTVPKKKSIMSAAATAGFNALGGMLAGRLRGLMAGFAPSVKGAGTIGVFLVSVALRYYARDDRGWNSVIREAAAGMAGFVGNDLWFVSKALIGWGDWKPETAYKADDVVIHEKKYYKASKDIPATPTAEPGKDPRWVLFETAQGMSSDAAMDPNAVSKFAQALASNDALLDGIVKEQLLIFGPELAQCAGRDLNQDEANHIYSGMRDSLKSVVQKFAA